MTRTEIARLLAIAAAAYDREIADPDALVAAWHMALDDVPADAAAQAFKVHYRENPWFPKPADIRRLVLSSTGAIPDANEAWRMVLQHMKDHGYINTPKFMGPKPVLEAVQAIGGFYRLRASTDPAKDREAFVRAYDTYAERAARDLDMVLAFEAVPALDG